MSFNELPQIHTSSHFRSRIYIILRSLHRDSRFSLRFCFLLIKQYSLAGTPGQFFHPQRPCAPARPECFSTNVSNPPYCAGIPLLPTIKMCVIKILCYSLKIRYIATILVHSGFNASTATFTFIGNFARSIAGCVIFSPRLGA